MKQRTSQILFAYWNNVRGGRVAPRRLEIEPSRITPILAETFILELTGNRTFTFRLAGTRICDQLGIELRGRNLIELFRDGDRDEIEGGLAAVRARGAVLVAEFAVGPQAGPPAERHRIACFELVVLPLTHQSDEISRFLGAISPIKPPHWLGHEPAGAAMLIEQQLVWPDGRPHAVIERGKRQAPFMPELAEARIVRFDRRQFRILEGGRKDPPLSNGD